jgi:phage baseplate assembly protein gpV
MALQPLSRNSTTEQLVNAINAVLQGRSNAVGTVTLTAGATTTTITDPRISADSAIVLVPTTANAAGAIATTYQSTTANGSVVIQHSNTASTDRTFKYVVNG